MTGSISDVKVWKNAENAKEAEYPLSPCGNRACRRSYFKICLMMVEKEQCVYRFLSAKMSAGDVIEWIAMLSIFLCRGGHSH